MQHGASQDDLQKVAQASVTYTPGTTSNGPTTGTFSLQIAGSTQKVDVLVYNPNTKANATTFTISDKNAVFIYGDWPSVGKTQTAEVFLDIENWMFTMTLWYGDQITGVFSSPIATSVPWFATSSRTATCTFNVC